jgi:hypothetical protein
VDATGPHWSAAHVAQALYCHGNTVRNVHQRFVAPGLEAALGRKKPGQPSRPRLLDGAQEAHVMALRCSQPPEGQAKWTLKLLADTRVELEVIKPIAYETVRQPLKTPRCNRPCISAG